MTRRHLLAAAVLAACSLGTATHALAQSMKPGLWEMNNKIGGSPEMDKAMAEMQQQMASMPPEQRKMMQDMMAKQGVTMGSNAAGGMSIKYCMTREMVERNEIAPQEGGCKTSYAPRVGSTMKMSFVCTKPPSSGEGQITFSGSDAYSSKMTLTTSNAGKSEKMTMEGQGKWLSAECGAVKPLVAPAK